MLYCDRSPNILSWSSEEMHIAYLSPKDDKYHNYYPDFYIEYTDKTRCAQKGSDRDQAALPAQLQSQQSQMGRG